MTRESKPDLKASCDPQVSVVVPFLNAERFLAETIESVLAQSYQDWELLLCDDGSTDGSTEIARRYAARHSGQIFYLEHTAHTHRGSSATRNLGLRRARGKFLAFLDADDVWLPHKLWDQVRLLNAHPEAGMLYGETLHWHSWTGDPRDAGRDYRRPLGVPVNTLSTPADILIRYLQGTAVVACTCSVLARRDIVERVGGFEESFQGMYDDQVFYAKMLLAAPVYVADRVWDKYRIHPGSMCNVAERTGETARVHLQYLEWLEQYLRVRGLARGPLWRALAAEKWRSRHPRVTRVYRGLMRRARMRLRRARV